MKTEKSNVKTFLVLVPHRDTRVILRKYSDKLIDNGLKGVYRFPLVSPLALLERPFTVEELKKNARSLRESVDKFFIEESGIMPWDDELKLFGAEIKNLSYGEGDLQMNIKQELNVHPQFNIIGTFLLPAEFDHSALPALQESFRAAALANMFWEPVKDGFKYTIEKLCWLPKKQLVSN